MVRKKSEFSIFESDLNSLSTEQVMNTRLYILHVFRSRGGRGVGRGPNVAHTGPSHQCSILITKQLFFLNWSFYIFFFVFLSKYLEFIFLVPHFFFNFVFQKIWNFLEFFGGRASGTIFVCVSPKIKILRGPAVPGI